MLKRLIEVALPLKEVSEQSAREKSIRHGHISTLHIGWARRPLAACRAVVFASLIPDPDDPECPESFRAMVRELLGRGEFKPKGEANGEPIADTPRNRCLEFIKHLVRWENSNNPEYIEPARKLIAAAHRFLHPDAAGDAPKVLDPFAGGGAIPLEALRLGCEAHAIDLNPVAHLIEHCTLVYPQKYGQPDSRPVPDYIKRLIAHNRARKKAKDRADLFDKMDASVDAEDGEVIPDVEITETEYRKNPLAADVKYWGHWIDQNVRREIDDCYSTGESGQHPVAFLWARTVRCQNPQCRATVPLLRQQWIARKKGRQIALQMTLDHQARIATFSVLDREPFPFDPATGTALKGRFRCPFCGHVSDSKYLKAESIAGRLGQQLMAVVEPRKDGKGKIYRPPEASDLRAYQEARDRLERASPVWAFNLSALPDEPISKKQPRVLFVLLYSSFLKKYTIEV
jgi:adenine-specific DNA methylase